MQRITCWAGLTAALLSLAWFELYSPAGHLL